jgi:pimeloyl-ACP methyl ester carboxylesterase
VRLAPLAEPDALPEFDPDAPASPGRYVAAAGASLYVRQTPSTSQRPEPALYVHGLAGSSSNWTDLAALLAPWLQGSALDLPGFGRSGPAPGGDYSVAAAARTVIDYLDTAEQGPVHLFGNSMGGAITVAVAARRPDLIRTLTLISPAVPDLRLTRPNADPLLALMLMPGPSSSYIEQRMELITPRQRVLGMLELCFADPGRVSQRRLAEAVAELTDRRGQPWTLTAFTRSLRGLVGHWLVRGRESPWRQLARVQAPSLVVWGDRDKLVDVALAPRTAAAIPDSRLLVLSGVGHTAQLEEPTLVARAFLALLSELPNR